MIRKPDYEGVSGKMWLCAMPTTPKRPDMTAALAHWLITCPTAHPIWHSYYLGIVHLRDIPGVPPANKHYPEAEYEIMLLALDPEYDLPNPDDGNNFNPHYLNPPNLVEHFHGVTDEEAIRLTELLAKGFVDGVINPDTDFHRHTQQILRNSIEHFAKDHTESH